VTWNCHLGHPTTPPITVYQTDTGPTPEAVEIRYCPTCRQEIRSTPDPASHIFIPVPNPPDTLPYTPQVCRECGQNRLHSNHGCDYCGLPMLPGETNTSNAIDGFYHGPCLARLVTWDQEVASVDVELNWDARAASASSALAIRREQGDMD